MERLLAYLMTNIGTKLISVVIAVVLWVVVLGSRNVEVTKDIPIEVVTSSEVIPSNEIPEKISFRLAGPKAFLRAILDRREDPIRVNLAGAKPGLVTYRFFSDNIRVPIGVKVLSINPASVLIKLEYVKRRDVPVKVELRGVPEDGYRVAGVEIKPSSVRIKGAESRIDSIGEIAAIPVDITNMRQTVEKEVAIDLARYGVQIDGPLPKVFVNIEPTSANFRIKNVELRVLTSYQYKASDRSITVLVRASPKDLKTLDRKHVFATIDLRGRPKGKYSEPVKVTLPENIGLVKAIPDKVGVTLY